MMAELILTKNNIEVLGLSDDTQKFSGEVVAKLAGRIIELDSEIVRLQSELKAANDDADRLASELEETYAHNDNFWEEPGESSPALIAHKARMVDATKMIHGGHNE